MLAYLLALAVGLGSFALYMAAFFFPEVHRKNDLIWSGVGLFYALVLWVCAGQIRGGLLLGQLAGVALLGWMSWQTLNLRRQVAPIEQQTPLPTSTQVQTALTNLASPAGLSRSAMQVKDWVQAMVATTAQAKPRATPSNALEDVPYVPLKPEDFSSAGRELREQVAEVTDAARENLAETPEKLADVVAEAGSEFGAVAQTGQRSLESAANPKAATNQRIVSQAAKSAKSSFNETAQVTKTGAKDAGSAIAQFPAKAIALAVTLTEVGKGLFKQKKPKLTYVRKEYRAGDASTTASDGKDAKPIADVTNGADDEWLDLEFEPSPTKVEIVPEMLTETGEAGVEQINLTAVEVIDSADDWFDESLDPTAATVDVTKQAIADTTNAIEQQIDQTHTDSINLGQVTLTETGNSVIEDMQTQAAGGVDSADDWFDETTEPAAIDVTPTAIADSAESLEHQIDDSHDAASHHQAG